MDKKMSPDFLSDLPMGIIHNILSFVPIQDAIGTSFLSRQWRYIWTSLPNLVFADCSLRFICQVLLLHEGPIHKLELHLPYIEVASRVQFQIQCIYQRLLLSVKDIRILVLRLDYSEPLIEVHSGLFSCQNLTHLELHLNTIPPPPPSFKGFLFLRSLDIRTPNVDSSTIESIVAHSPLLERLWLTTGHPYSEMTVRAPKLNFLHFGFGSTHLSLCTPLLEELIVDFAEIKHFSFHGFLVFHHLKTVAIHSVRFNRTEATMAVDCLIRSSPNLQKLTISNWSPNAQEIDYPPFWDIESAPDFTYESLKIIKMSLSGCGINEMKLIKFLLARSPVLERMLYQPRSPLSPQVLLNLEAELLSCHRASANAEIVIGKLDPRLLQMLRL